jgi:TonB family protein
MLYGLMLVVATTTPPSPTPAASRRLCANPNHEAYVEDRIYPSVLQSELDEAIALGAKPSVVVRIVVGPDGHLRAATIFRTSGSWQLDAAALRAAHLSTYLPKQVGCKPVTGVYQLPYSFSSQRP